jgi:ABC-type sugar transport system ATPase subunit
MTLGDKIAVMRDGVVQQFGSPQDIYDRPANMFVAGFIGSPSMNFMRGKLRGNRINCILSLNIRVKALCYRYRLRRQMPSAVPHPSAAKSCWAYGRNM